MAKEIERKFLVEGDGWRDAVARSVAIRQFYLVVAEDRSVRVRVTDETDAVLTVKAGRHGLVRSEFEYHIPLADAEAMQALAKGHPIEKTRHVVEYGGHSYEIDVFAGRLEGLVLAELETPEAGSVETLPPWLGREVTGEADYYNSKMADGRLPAAS